MSDTELSLLAGGLLSLLFSYVPKLRDWYDVQDSTTKRLVMGSALLIVSLAIFGATCANLGLPFQTTCDQSGAVGLALIFVRALAVNQATYAITSKGRASKDQTAQKL